MSRNLPILFSTPMVQAILAKRKTQTRRIVKFPKGWIPEDDSWDWVALKEYYPKWGSKIEVGDILWVRETWMPPLGFGTINRFMYKADDDIPCGARWKPSIFMPKKACRIFLKVTNKRVERLQNISEADAIEEGVDNWTYKNMDHPQNWLNYSDPLAPPLASAIDSFISLWESINGQYSWETNPFVWVYDFQKIERPEIFLS